MTTYLGWDYYTLRQILNQFVKGLRSSILQSVRSRHPTNLQEAVTLAHDFESAEQEANHTQAVNLAINGASNIDAKITQLSKKLTQKIEEFLAGTTEIYQPPQQRENNNSSRYPQHQNHQQQQQPWRSDPHNCYGTTIPIPIFTAPILTTIHYQNPIYNQLKPHAIDYNQKWRNPSNNQMQTNSGLVQSINHDYVLSQPVPSEYPNQVSYLGFNETQDFDSPTLLEKKDVEELLNPLSQNQTPHTIPPTIITENTTLTTIFSFDVDNLYTTSLFSKAAINQDKLITAMYAKARIENLDIKLILNSGSAGMNHAVTTRIITVNGNTKTLIEEIDNFPFEINGIQILTKVQHVRVPAMCGHFKTQDREQPLIEFEDTIPLPIIEIYQVSWADDLRTELPPPPT
ncbi:hypothetical protein G9A89_017201 [Geosiphon pyriformis]|nr:hypothetical protein G9A89_017201 [Geosiphon pyriformis]